jgi:gas vesicle protein
MIDIISNSPAAAATHLPWMESVGVGAAVTMVVLFLKYMAKKDEATNKVVSEITKDFSQTVRDVSRDVKTGISTIHEHTQTLLADSREREAKHYEHMNTLQNLISGNPKP